ncbi:unnamed protein product [Prorocentrum cordatum]|uniref:Uncharacterized protein n=1 Tax=Prorocentrum cordatum TaxID=2364126 RepID=A0ABN9TBF5_9DINO|nr:unnamed protein product [Polarella glacialis]
MDEELFEYNCTAELDNWEVGWSTPKKAWCCEQRQVGCPVEASEARLEEKYDRLAAVPAWWERGRSPPQGPLGRLGRVPVFTALAAGLAVLASLTAVVLARQGLCRQGGGLPGLQRRNYVELEVPIAP